MVDLTRHRHPPGLVPAPHQHGVNFQSSEGGQSSETVDSVLFHCVPEGKVVKNRLHLDVWVGGVRGAPKELRRPLVDAEVGRLLRMGATHVRTDDDETDYFAVMRDPEGNEFCIC
jgi:hypothetical protein